MDDRLHSEKQIKSLLPIAVISEIPQIMTPVDEQNLRKRMALGWVAAVLLVGTIFAGSVFSYLRN